MKHLKNTLDRYTGGRLVKFDRKYDFRLYVVDKWYGLPRCFGLLVDSTMDPTLRASIVQDLLKKEVEDNTQLGIITPAVANITWKLTNYYPSITSISNSADYGSVLGSVATVMILDIVPPPNPLTLFDSYEWSDVYRITYYIKRNGQHGVMDPVNGDVPELFERLEMLNL